MIKALVARIIVVGSLLLVGSGLALWKYSSIKRAGAAGAYPEPAEAVEVVQARTAQYRPIAELSGTVIALESVTLSNEVAGSVKEVKFESGTVVEAGQIIVTLDASTEEAELRGAEASIGVSDADINVARADVRLAESNVERLTRAVSTRAASAAELDQARSALDSALARVQRSEAERLQAGARADQMRSTIAKKTLRAPFKAMAGLRNIHPGQYLAEGSTVVGLQSVSDHIYLDFALPQEQAARASVGMVVMAEAPMIGPDPVRIEVVAIDAVANPTTRNIRVRAIVANPGMRLRPGMFVDIKAPVDEAREHVVVPATAVRRASFGDHVFLIQPSKDAPDQLRASQRFVTLGPAMGDDIVVLDGLKPGDELAAGGSFKLRDKALVTRAAPGQAAGGR